MISDNVKSKWINVMDSLKSKVDVVLDAIPVGSSVCFIDYPVYDNTGDLLIMLGTEEFIRSNKIKVVARYSALDCPDKLKLPHGTIIMFQGGGNFGDLYYLHQHTREKITKENPHHRVVVLPQTVFYSAKDEAKNLISCMGSHPDLHIFVRDLNSQESISRLLPNANVKCSPDMAHYLWPKYYSGFVKGGQGVPLRLIRRDKESAHIELNSKQTMDWGDFYSKADKGFMRLFKAFHKPGMLSGNFTARIWLLFSRHVVRKARRKYKYYDRIETSRLHGHILACLMGIPVWLHDNSYGKNSSYFHLWTHELPGCHMMPHKNIVEELVAER